MSTSCGCFRFWLDDDEGLDPESIEQLARAEHHRLCPDCREEMRGIIAQRATLRGTYRSDVAQPPLVQDLVARCVSAMKQAAQEGGGVGQSSG